MTRSAIRHFAAEDWLEHREFLAGLARGVLAGRADEPEDVAQSTWLEALRLRPSDVRDPRSWLAHVGRNVARWHGRSERRRRTRERAAALDEHADVPSAATVAERLEAQRLVADAAASLPEPYRTAVFLRYYEGRPPRAIAAALDLPVETVRTRLKRALGMLRRDLDDTFGEPGRTEAALLPWAVPLGGTHGVTWFGTGLLMTKTTKGLAAVAALALLTWGSTHVFDGFADAPTPTARADGRIADVTGTADAEPRPTVDAPASATHPTESRRELETTAARRPQQGKLELVEHDGSRVVDADGELHVRWRQAGATGRVVVDVRDGAWSTSAVPRDADLTFFGASLNDAPAVVRRRAEDRHDVIELVAERIRGAVTLHVVDAETGTPLDAIETRSSARWAQRRHPAGLSGVKTEHTDGASPLALHSATVRATWFVRAPGYAWNSIVVYHDDEAGERTIELGRAGAVELIPTGAIPQDERVAVALRIAPPPVPADVRADFAKMLKWHARHRPLEQPILERELDPATAAGTAIGVDEVAAGAYYADLVVGKHAAKRLLVSERLDIVAGETTRVVLDAAPTSIERVPVRGTLALPAGIAARELTVSIGLLQPRGRGQAEVTIAGAELADDAAAAPLVRDAATIVTWDAGDVVPGDYRLRVDPYQYRVRLAVGPEGATDVAIELPPRADVELSALDATTGRTVVPRRASWGNGRVPGISSNRLFGLRPDGSTGAMTLRTVAGTIVVDLEHPDYEPFRDEIAVRAGEQTVELPLVPATGLRIALFENGSRLPAEALWSAITLDSPRPWHRQISGERESTWFYPAAADGETLTIRVGDVPGYAVVAPRPVELVANRIVDVRIDLEPK